MNKNFEVGVVWSVRGNEVVVKMHKVSNDFVYFYNGEEYEGIRNGGYLSITRGHVDIICKIESEEIRDNFIKLDDKTQDFNSQRYEKYVYAKSIGFIENDRFVSGIKYSPIIYNTVKIMSNTQINQVFNSSRKEQKIKFPIGKELQYSINVQLPWEHIFNTHIGIFGNTGSGKSNTLTQLYTKLLTHPELDVSKSEFLIVDFNGEYIGENVICSGKEIYKLSTRKYGGEDKFSIGEDSFWDEEVLGILFHATEKTQKPFLKRLVDGRKKYKDNENSLIKYIRGTYKQIFTSQDQKKETLELMRNVLEIINNEIEDLEKVVWWNNYNCFYLNGYYSNKIKSQEEIIEILKIGEIQIRNNLTPFEELEIRVNLQMIQGLLYNFIQFDNINPLLSRIQSTGNSLAKIMKIEKEDAQETPKDKNIRVISLRNCNQEIKKIFPILLAKECFKKHKDINETGEIKKTFHLIIDEAHNILSHQSNREAESWKDYRLELFEEIIKEGRKFGFFLTVSSQRPADISETLMSQFHNFFIHRLINDKDLKLIDNVISTLDRTSRQLIPILPQGACILTGTAFDFPQVVQVEKIEDKKNRPNSDDIDLMKMWEKK